MPFRVILPTKYVQNKVSRFPVIYLLHGLSGRYTDWSEKAKLSEYSSKYDFIVVLREGGDGWYTDSVSKENDKYESYLISELIPEIDEN